MSNVSNIRILMGMPPQLLLNYMGDCAQPLYFEVYHREGSPVAEDCISYEELKELIAPENCEGWDIHYMFSGTEADREEFMRVVDARFAFKPYYAFAILKGVLTYGRVTEEYAGAYSVQFVPHDEDDFVVVQIDNLLRA